jgi:hypothetical protein
MECWVQQDIILDDDKAHQSVKEAWEHEDGKDEFKIELQVLEKQMLLPACCYVTVKRKRRVRVSARVCRDMCKDARESLSMG